MNAVESLVVFAPLVLAVQVSGAANDATATACAVYFWARLIHALFYIVGVRYVRTLSWTVGFMASWALAYELYFTIS